MASQEELDQLGEIQRQLAALEADFEHLGSAQSKSIIPEITDITRELRRVEGETIQPAEPIPEAPLPKRMRSIPRQLDPNKHLMPEHHPGGRPCTEAHVKYIDNPNEMVRYPLPDEVFPQRTAPVFVSTLFFDFRKDQDPKQDVAQGNLMFPPCPVPALNNYRIGLA
jgi:hypothetical protein